jgi:hypothetical protein
MTLAAILVIVRGSDREQSALPRTAAERFARILSGSPTGAVVLSDGPAY